MYTCRQLEILETSFACQAYLNSSEEQRLIKELAPLKLTQIRCWFANKRRNTQRKELILHQAMIREEDERGLSLPFSVRQRQLLMQSFKEASYPTLTEVRHIALEAGLSEVQTQNWFRNRRRAVRKQVNHMAAVQLARTHTRREDIKCKEELLTQSSNGVVPVQNNVGIRNTVDSSDDAYNPDFWEQVSDVLDRL